MENNFKISDQDLVKMKVETSHGNIWPWFRVKFADNDGTFIGTIEKHPKNVRIHEYLRGYVRYKNSEVHQVLPGGKLPEGKQFCYSDDISICDCPGTCRNK